MVVYIIIIFFVVVTIYEIVRENKEFNDFKRKCDMMSDLDPVEFVSEYERMLYSAWNDKMKKYLYKKYCDYVNLMPYKYYGSNISISHVLGKVITFPFFLDKVEDKGYVIKDSNGISLELNKVFKVVEENGVFTHDDLINLYKTNC